MDWYRDADYMKLNETIHSTLKEITKNHIKKGAEYRWNKDLAFWIEVKGQFIGILDSGMQLVHNLVRRVYELRPYAKELFSEKFVVDQIIESVKNIALTEMPDRVDSEVKRLLDEFGERRQHWTIVIPVENLVAQMKFSIARVHLYPGLDVSIKAIIDDLKVNPQKPDLPKGLGLDYLLKDRREFSFAVVETETGDQDMAIKNAISVLELELSLLRLVSLSKFFGIPGGYPRGNRDMIMYCRETAGVTSKFSAVGALVPLYMNKREIGLLNDDVTLRRIGEALRKNDKQTTALEDRLIRALAWFGKSTLHLDQREAILDAFIGMEALLLDKFEAAKKETIAERSAFLLVQGGEQRLEVYRRVARVCDVRNDIAHNGLLAVSQNDAEEAIYILRLLVLCVADLTDRFTEFDQLRDYVLKLKFPGGLSESISGLTQAKSEN